MHSKDEIIQILDTVLTELDNLRVTEDLLEDEHILLGKAFDYVEKAYDIIDTRNVSHKAEKYIEESIKLLEKAEKSLRGEISG